MNDSGKLYSVFMMSVIFVIAFFLISPSDTYSQEVIKIKAATIHPVAHRLTSDAYDVWTKEISKRTNGKAEITWFPGGTVANAAQSYDALVGGLTDISIVCVYALPHVFPYFDILSHPFLVDNPVHATELSWSIYKNIPEVQKEMSKMKVLGFFSTDIVQMAVTKPPVIKTLNDLKGKQIVCPAPTHVEMLKAIGAAPMLQKLGDIYLSLQRNIADGVIFPIAPMRSFKLVELSRYYTIINMAVGPHIVAMNMDKWEKLPPDVQKVFEETGRSLGFLAAHTLTNESAWVLEKLKERGDEIYALPKEERENWKKATQPLYDKWVQRVNGMGSDGEALLKKVFELSQEPQKYSTEVDDWWKQGRMGKENN